MKTDVNMRMQDCEAERRWQEHVRPAREQVIVNGDRVPIGNRQSAIGNHKAFSLIEIIIVVGLLSVIMLGLMMMFTQTQRVFRTSMTQVDVLEAGRAATGLMANELAQMTPAGGVITNFYAGVLGGNLLKLPLPGGAVRTNVLQDMFFLTRENQTWTGIGYFVRYETNGQLYLPTTDRTGNQLAGGKLFRFEEKVSATVGPEALWGRYYYYTTPGRATPTNVTAVMDGVIHFRARAYDTNGVWLQNYSIANSIFAAPAGPSGEATLYNFQGDAVPASIELEFGLVENRTWDRYNSLPAGTPRYNYLTNQVGRVQIFRQLVPVRNVDPTAYQ